MTEAMSRSEIEDVLSSIKRLVSHDSGARTASRGKLVLTSALRVDASSPQPEPEPETIPPIAAAEAPDVTEPVAPPSLIRRIAEARSTAEAPLPDPEPEPDAPAPDLFAQTVEDAALEATLARLETMLSTSSQTSLDTPPAPGEPIIDERMLAQIVAHMVRQELQGELGEKITRNIRKLVRAEVARELQLRKS